MASTSELFPNCFYLSLGTSKFPFTFGGKYYIWNLDLMEQYYLIFNRLRFLSYTVRDQEVGSSNLLSPTSFSYKILITQIRADYTDTRCFKNPSKSV